MTFAEIVRRAGLQADPDTLLDLLAQIYEAGFAHGAENHVAQLVSGPLSRAELVQLIDIVRRRRYELLNCAADALTLEV